MKLFWGRHVLFFGLFRKANLFAKQKFDADKHFTRDSFVLNADCSFTVCVRWSKTIQCREREIRVTLPALHPHPCAPCQRSAKRSALLSISPQRRQPSPCQEQCVWQEAETGHPVRGNLSRHSFRGGACWALSQNIPGEIIKIMGDWKSTVYMSYLDQLPQPMLDYYRVVFFPPRSPTYM